MSAFVTEAIWSAGQSGMKKQAAAAAAAGDVQPSMLHHTKKAVASREWDTQGLR